MKIKQLTDDDLLRGLSDRDPPKPDLFNMWVDYKGLHPGTSRVHNKTLYADYRTWCEVYLEQHPEISSKVLSPVYWGKRMTERFRSGTSGAARFYYVSGKDNEKVLAKLNRYIE